MKAVFGDSICRMTAVKYLLETQKHLNIHLWLPDYFIPVAKNLVPQADIHSFKEKDKYIHNIPGRTSDESVHTLLATHLIDQAFHVLVDQQVDIKYKNYIPLNLKPISINKFNLPNKYVVVTTGFTADVREMTPATINTVVDFILSKNYKVVFLGKRQTITGTHHIIKGEFKSEVDYSKGINLIDKTDLLEAGKIIAGARAIVGLDNGLLHIAGCTSTAIVAGFTSVKPEHRAPIRNNEYGWNFYPVVPPESLACRFCQSNWAHVYDVNFTKCYYKENNFDTEIQCVKQLTGDLYIKELEKIL